MELRDARIAVTGATGFLGRYIVDELQRRGAHVIGVVRNPNKVPALAERGVELRQADLADRDALTRGFAGADAVVSNAALLTLKSVPWQEMRDTNVAGTENVFEAVAAAGVKRVVQVSSIAVYRRRWWGPVPEEHPKRPDPGPKGPWARFGRYAASKALSERLAWNKADALGLALSVVRPGSIFGAFDPTFTRVFKGTMRRKVAVVPLGFRLPFVYGGDVAVGIAEILSRPASVGRAYNLAGAATFWRFADAWQAIGQPAPRWRIPIPVPPMSRYDSQRAQRELGWKQRSLHDALRETVELEAAG